MKNELDQLADRHLRDDPNGALLSKVNAKKGSILVSQSMESASSIAGQHTVWMLINLLCRQFGLVQKISLDIPDIEAIQTIAPFGQEATLKGTLLKCVELVSGDHMEVVDHLEDSAPDFHIILGLVPKSNSVKTLYVYGAGWKWYVGESIPLINEYGSNPICIGAYLAACFASGEIFKFLRGMVQGKGEFITSMFGSAWDVPSEGDSWDALSDGPDTFPDIGHVYLAGAGAVGQSAMLTLGMSMVEGSMTIVDHDFLDLSNDNRYAISNKGDQNKKKSIIAEDFLAKTRIKPVPVDKKWEQHARDAGKATADQAISVLEKKFKYRIVLSCVDDNGARHAIQNLIPFKIIGGSTDGMVAKAINYRLDGTAACLKCFNAILDRNRIADDLLKSARNMTEDERKALCIEREIDYELLMKVIQASGCGKLSEQDLENFTKGAREMSVGFVSVAAGVLVAVHLLKYVLGVENPDKNSSFLTFAKPHLTYRILGQESTCNCHNVLHGRWQSIWS